MMTNQIDTFEILQMQLEKDVNKIDAFEAAKEIINNKLTRKKINELANIAVNGIEIHNKEAATYALSWIENNDTALDILINLFLSSHFLNLFYVE